MENRNLHSGSKQRKGGVSRLSLLLRTSIVLMWMYCLMNFFPLGAEKRELLALKIATSVVGKEEKTLATAAAAAAKTMTSYSEEPACLDLPAIRPSGVFFMDRRVKRASSPESVRPQFYIGSMFPPNRVSGHMGTDLAHFALISEFFPDNNNKRLALDIGANQGFFTYFLATSGFEQVHAFEIGQNNFLSLEHGRHFNPKAVADRVFLYPMGLSSKTGRIGMQGADYGGFLTESKDGTIQSATLDCFAHHTAMATSSTNSAGGGVSLFSGGVDFVKVDVEGFEIEVIKGGLGSVFRPGANRASIGALMIEVGPARWSRAGTEFASGLSVMQNTLAAGLFRESFILLRYQKAGHWKTCPPSLEEHLSDKNPKVLIADTTKMFKVQPNEWEPLLSKMKENDFDCNFWFSNRGVE